MIAFYQKPDWADFSVEALNTWLQEVAQVYGKSIGTLSYTFLSDEEIQRMNLDYLQHDYPTDIISFDYSEGDVLSGEIFIGSDVVRENGHHYKVDEREEMCRVMVHGLLHLAGFKDHSTEEKKQMRSNEDKCLLLRPKILINK